VTLWDEEANRRGVQKMVMERKGPSAFSYGVEIISKTELRVHCSLEATVYAILLGIFSSDIVKQKHYYFMFQFIRISSEELWRIFSP
jgi:uncharacterized membrane protein YadS